MVLSCALLVLGEGDEEVGRRVNYKENMKKNLKSFDWQ